MRPGFRPKLESKLVAAIHAGTDIDVVECIECKATRTRIEGGKWVITRGLVTTKEMRDAANRIGAKAFLDVSFAFDPEAHEVEMGFTVVRARDAQVVWSDTFTANETTPMLLRSSEAPMKRKDRLRDLEMLLEGRPFYGYMASAGFMLIPYDDPIPRRHQRRHRGLPRLRALRRGAPRDVRPRHHGLLQPRAPVRRRPVGRLLVESRSARTS